MSHATGILDGSVELFALQRLEISAHVATDSEGRKVPQVGVAMIGVPPKVDVGAKTYAMFLSVKLARGLGGAFADSAEEAVQEAGVDPDVAAPASALTTAASMADVHTVARQAAAADRLRA